MSNNCVPLAITRFRAILSSKKIPLEEMLLVSYVDGKDLDVAEKLAVPHTSSRSGCIWMWNIWWYSFEVPICGKYAVNHTFLGRSWSAHDWQRRKSFRMIFIFVFDFNIEFLKIEIRAAYYGAKLSLQLKIFHWTQNPLAFIYYRSLLFKNYYFLKYLTTTIDICFTI